MRARALVTLSLTMAAVLGPAVGTTFAQNSAGGAEYGDEKKIQDPSRPTVPGSVAKLIDGVAYAPEGAPMRVQKAIWAGNDLQDKPYRYGGGHRTFKDSGYDCSGTISYALNGGKLLGTGPLDSSGFMKWGKKGRGEWVTVYSNPGHAYVMIAGLRLDTSGSSGKGPRWRPEKRSTRGYRVRHPAGY